MTPNEVIKLAKDNNVQFVDLLYGDMFGIMQHFTFPAYSLDAAMFSEGMAFDGSSIRGWKTIDKSDMIMKPDPESAFLDPFRAAKTRAQPYTAPRSRSILYTSGTGSPTTLK